MSLYSRGNRHSLGINRRMFRYLIIALAVLAALSLGLSLKLILGTKSDNQIQGVIIERVIAEEQRARTTAAQISRNGGSNSLIMLAQTRQHLYALSMLNELYLTLVNAGQSAVPQAPINESATILTQIEQRILESATFDTELNALWLKLTEITEAAEGLSSATPAPGEPTAPV